MGEIVTYPSNGKTARGYLATPSEPGPGVVVIQEWWGLVPHIKDVCDRLSSEGFVALAPDLFNGVTTTEPDEAGKLMMDLDLERAGKDMSGAVDFLLAHASVEPDKIGCVGFCMGGALSLTLATIAPIEACVTYYGVPTQAPPDYSKIRGPVLGHFAEHDGWASHDAATALFDTLQSLGKTGERYTYPGTEHAFFNDARPEVYHAEAASQSWDRTLEFLRKNLG